MRDKPKRRVHWFGSNKKARDRGCGRAYWGTELGLRRWLGWQRRRRENFAPAEVDRPKEPLSKRRRRRVYEAADGTRETALTRSCKVSTAMKRLAPGAKPTEIGREAGGRVRAIRGLKRHGPGHLELCRTRNRHKHGDGGGWDPGDYSLAKFRCVAQGTDPRLVLTTRISTASGTPAGDGEVHYWEASWRNFWVSYFLNA